MPKLLLSFGLFTSLVLAEDSARLAGTVTDPTGAVIPKATVTVTNEKTGIKREVVADDKGYYIATNLAPATYTIVSTSANLGPAEFKEVALTVGQERTLNIVLQPASVATEIIVSGGELSVRDLQLHGQPRRWLGRAAPTPVVVALQLLNSRPARYAAGWKSLRYREGIGTRCPLSFFPPCHSMESPVAPMMKA